MKISVQYVPEICWTVTCNVDVVAVDEVWVGDYRLKSEALINSMRISGIGMESADSVVRADPVMQVSRCGYMHRKRRCSMHINLSEKKMLIRPSTFSNVVL